MQTTSFKVGFEVEQKDSNIKKENLVSNNKENNTSEKNTEEKNQEIKEEKENNLLWYLEIPSINLKAKIAEGTTKEIMDKYIGHFEETSNLKGNIGLAAHNRGYEKNYFADLKKLKEGDKIIYYYYGNKIEYIVENTYIIQDTNWKYLEPTKDNRITLITCVENEPNYRRCVQGVENKKD